MAAMEAVLRIRAEDDVSKTVEALKAKLLGLEKSIAPVDKLVSSLGAVTRSTDPMAGALASAEKALAAQRKEIFGVVAALDRVVGPTDRAAAAQRTLARSVESTTGAFAKQGEAAARAAQRAGAGGARGGGGGGGGGFMRAAGGAIAMAEGMGPVFAAIEAVEIGKKAIENGAELEQQRFRVRELSRNDPGEAADADRLAADIAAKYPSITRARALDTYSELRANAAGADGKVDPDVARRNLLAASKAQAAALALGVEFTPSDAQNLMKAVEGSGRAGDPNAIARMFDTYLRFKQVMGTALNSQMIRDYVQNAKSANFAMGDDQFFGPNFVRMAEGNASRLGNEASQTLQTIAGGHMTKAAGQWLVDHGLARPDQIVKNGPSAIKIVGGVKDEATLETASGLWAATTLKDAIEKSGALSDEKVNARAKMMRDQELKANPNAQIDERSLRERAEHGIIATELAKTGWRTTVTDDLSHWIALERQIARDVAQGKNASGTDAADRLGQNPVAAFQELSSAISNFGAVLTGPLVAGAAPLLDATARGLASFTVGLQGVYDAIARGYHMLPGLFSPTSGPLPANVDRLVDKIRYEREAFFHGSADEMREHNRGVALSHLMEGGHVAQEVSVHGDATVQTNITVTASSELLSIVQAARTVTAQMALNPLANGHRGRMDSDAAPAYSRGSWDR